MDLECALECAEEEQGTSSCPIVISDSPIKLASKAEAYKKVLADISSESEDEDVNTSSPAAKRRRIIFDVCDSELVSEDDERPPEEPIFEIPPEKYAAERIIKILLDPAISPSKICDRRPLLVNKSSTFVVNLDSLDDPADVKKDNFGIWNYSGSHDVKFECRISKGVVEIGRSTFLPGSGWEQFSLRRLRSIHPSNADFKRMLAFITDNKGNPHHLCLLVYYVPDNFMPEIKPHGNSKSSQPYFPTWPSTMKMVKTEVSRSGPKEVISVVSAKVGGVVGAVAPGQLPRGEMQVSNVKRGVKVESCGDELYAVMQRSKMDSDFIRGIKASPDPAIVLGSNRQLDDLVRFCATSAGIECSVMTVDPTFCLGDFECTPTTYRHLLLVSRRYGKPPVFIGPVLIHYRKNFGTFMFFSNSLVGLRRSLEGLRCFGTDGEKALVDAFLHEFRFSIHLYCQIHFRSNVKNELCRRNFPTNVVSDIVDDIFGKQSGSTYIEGLVDADSDTIFYTKLEEKGLEWKQKEKENPACTPGFFDWFNENKVDHIVSGMLKPLREEAGLGCPPCSFTTNASESLNAMLKRKVNYKRNDLPEFVDQLKQLIEEQDRELERAVIGRGKYQFRDEFRSLEIKETDWFRMSREQREHHLCKVAKVMLPSACPSISQPLVSTLPELPIPPEDFQAGLKIPLASVQGIWHKASELVSQPSASFSSAPGYGSDCKMVVSRKGKRPHLVTKGKAGKYFCDGECANWKSLGLCAHVVAVAHTNGELEEFCNSYRKTKKLPNVTKLLLTGLPGGIGNKGNRVTRKRKKLEISNRIPLSGSSACSDFSSDPSLPSMSGPSSSSCQEQSKSDTPPETQIPQSTFYSSLGTSLPSGMPPNSPIFAPQWQCEVSSAAAPYTPSVSSLQVQSPLSMQWVNVQPPNPWACYTPQPTSDFYLCFRSGNVSVCNGCRNKFKKQAKPPHDLCIRHQEWRSFVSPVSKQPEERFGNAYYHASPPCIQARWPAFSPASLIVSQDVSSRLLVEHKEYISFYFGIAL